MSAITFYDANGRIDYSVQGDSHVIDQTIQSVNRPYVEGNWSDKTHYVFNKEIKNRPNNPTVLDGLVLRNVPAPCKIIVNQTLYTNNDSVVELDLPLSDIYKITVVSFPYLNAEFEIET